MSQSRFDPFARQCQGLAQPPLTPAERRRLRAAERRRETQEAKRLRAVKRRACARISPANGDSYATSARSTTTQRRGEDRYIVTFRGAGCKPDGTSPLDAPAKTQPPVAVLGYGVDDLGDVADPAVDLVLDGLRAKGRTFVAVPWPTHPASHLKALGCREAVVFVAPGPDDGGTLACDLGALVLAGVKLVVVPILGADGLDVPVPATRLYYKGQPRKATSDLTGGYQVVAKGDVRALAWKRRRWSYDELAATLVPAGACGTMRVFHPDQLLAVGLVPPDDVDYPAEVDVTGFRFDQLRPGYVDWLVGCPWLYGQFRDKLRAFHAHPVTQERLGNLAEDREYLTGPNLFFPTGWFGAHNEFHALGYARTAKAWDPAPKPDLWVAHGTPTWARRPATEDDDPAPAHWQTGLAPWVDFSDDEYGTEDDEFEGTDYVLADEEPWDWQPTTPPDCRHGVQPEDQRTWNWLTTRQKDRLTAAQADAEVSKRLARREANAWRQGLRALQEFERLGGGEHQPQDDDAQRLDAAARLITPDVKAWLALKHVGHTRVFAHPNDARGDETVTRGTDKGYKPMWRATTPDATSSLLLELREAYRRAKAAVEGMLPTEDSVDEAESKEDLIDIRSHHVWELTRVG